MNKVRNRNISAPSKKDMLFVLRELRERNKLTEEEYYRAIDIVHKEKY